MSNFLNMRYAYTTLLVHIETQKNGTSELALGHFDYTGHGEWRAMALVRTVWAFESKGYLSHYIEFSYVLKVYV